MRDLTIMCGSIPLAVRDHGGEGPPLLLLHGAGGNLASMTGLARELTGAFRVVTPDLRGHGHTGDAPWDWDGVLDDLRAVADEFGFAQPYVAGMSLGGMLAAMWAARHPDCPGAVSLDGNATVASTDQLAPDPENTGADLEADLARLTALFDAMEAMMAAPLTGELRAAAEVGQRATARRYGADEELYVEAFRRGIEHDRIRPGAELTRQLRVAMHTVDLLAVYRRVRCPLLLVLATTDLPEQEPFHALYDANRRHLGANLSTVDNRWVTVLELAGASHAMCAERPAEIAALIAARR